MGRVGSRSRSGGSLIGGSRQSLRRTAPGSVAAELAVQEIPRPSAARKESKTPEVHASSACARAWPGGALDQDSLQARREAKEGASQLRTIVLIIPASPSSPLC